MRLLLRAAAMPEFFGYNGDCGETAELALLHVITGEPMNATNLNTLVKKEIGDHEASASGAEAINAIAQDLRERKIAFDFWPYAQPFTFDWKTLLRDFAGIDPIILEVANAQALSGDEKGVHYHFICVVGFDEASGRYIVADGDNVAARTNKFAYYTEEMLNAAIPCAAIRGHMPPVPKSVEVYGYFEEVTVGEWRVLPGHGVSSGKSITGVMLDAYKVWPAAGTEHGLTAFGLPLADEADIPNHPGCWWQPFERGTLIYDPHRVVDNPPGSQGNIYAAHTTYHP
jgi:hypothetical protein